MERGGEGDWDECVSFSPSPSPHGSQTCRSLRAMERGSGGEEAMIHYIARRLLFMIPTLIIISMVSFFLIQLPPGDFLTSYAATLAQQGEGIDNAQLVALKQHYGLDQPVYVQ